MFCASSDLPYRFRVVLNVEAYIDIQPCRRLHLYHYRSTLFHFGAVIDYSSL